MFAGLVKRLVVVAFVAWLVAGYVLLVNVTGDNLERARAGCERWPGHVKVVRVPGGVVAYAGRQGWPRVLRKGGDRLLGDVVAYDGGREARWVLRRTRWFCHGQRYRLGVSR